MSSLKKKITILNFDLSDNSLGRAYLIAKALSGDFEVEIAGPAIKGYIWGFWSSIAETERKIKAAEMTMSNLNLGFMITSLLALFILSEILKAINHMQIRTRESVIK